MKAWVIAILCCVAMGAVRASAQDEGFQTATVISIEKLAADAQHMEKGDQFKISMSMGSAVYLCKVSAPSATFMEVFFPQVYGGSIFVVLGETALLGVYLWLAIFAAREQPK